MATPLQIATYVLYQPDPVLNERFPSGMEPFATFLKQVEVVLTGNFPPGEPPQEFDLVIAVKPGGRARYWFVSTAPRNATLEDSLRDKLAAVSAPQVVGGPVAVAIIASTGGAPTSDKSKPFSAPMPAEWREATDRATGPLRVPEGLLPLVWPD